MLNKFEKMTIVRFYSHVFFFKVRILNYVKGLNRTLKNYTKFTHWRIKQFSYMPFRIVHRNTTSYHCSIFLLDRRYHYTSNCPLSNSWIEFRLHTEDRKRAISRIDLYDFSSMEFGNGRFFRIPRSCTFSRKVLWCWATKSGFTVCTSFLSSSMSLLSFALLFWNHVITWALLRPSWAAISSLSAGLKYFWYRNLFSSSKICWFVNAVRLLRFFFGCWRLLNRFKWLACSETQKIRHD